MHSLFVSLFILFTCIFSNGRSRYLLVKLDNGESLGMLFTIYIYLLYLFINVSNYFKLSIWLWKFVLGDPEWTCVGKPCGTPCPLGHCPDCRPGFGAGICDNETESCVSAFYNPCAVHGCEGKMCGEKCLMGDLMNECDANGDCIGRNHVCPKGLVSNTFI